MNAIEIRNLTKKFRVYHARESNLLGSLSRLLQFKKSTVSQEFIALSHIDLDIQQGEVVGLIGQNGSGKSTLLKIMAGILYADGGTINVEGSIGTLIELAAGFHPELSGRENIYINDDRKCQTHIHPHGIHPNRRVNELLYTGELHDGLVFGIDLFFGSVLLRGCLYFWRSCFLVIGYFSRQRGSFYIVRSWSWASRLL